MENNIDFEFAIRKLEENQNNALVFLGKVGLGISKENLEKSNFTSYDNIFLILDKEDYYNGKTTLIEKQKCATIRYRGSHK